MDKRRKIHDFQEFKGRASIFQEWNEKHPFEEEIPDWDLTGNTGITPHGYHPTRVSPHAIKEKNEERVNKSVV